MAQKPLDLIGIQFGRLTVLERRPRTSDTSRNSRWLCKCVCGSFREVSGKELVNGNSTSCGCYQKEMLSARNYKHGHSGSKEHQAWNAAKKRCFDQNHHSYKDYGARGITMCDEWANDFRSFFEAMGKSPKGSTLERIDNNDGYRPGNCKWATMREQTNNRRITIYVTTPEGKMALSDVAEKYGLKYQSIYHFIVNRKLPFKEAISRSSRLVEKALSR